MYKSKKKLKEKFEKYFQLNENEMLECCDISS